MSQASASALPPVTLILGGARSGKSSYALSLLADRSRAVFLATAAAGDEEMAERIRIHQRQRGDRWRTVEEQLDLASALSRLGREGAPILVDCLTLWLSNLLFAERDIDASTTELVTQLRNTPVPVVLVSNEVGLGLVPETELGRWFRDSAGRLHQRIASVAQRVVFIAAGLPLMLKDESWVSPAPVDPS